MIEPISKSIIFGMIATGETITKNTGVSLALVLTIMGATIFVTNTYAHINAQLNQLTETVEQLQTNQAGILKALQNNDALNN